MVFIKVKELKAGMTLAEDLTAADGRKLLGEGSVISAAVIQKLEKIGIHEVNVSPQGFKGENKLNKFQTKEELNLYVNRKFLDFEQGDFVEQLKELSRKYLNEQNPVRK